MDGNKPTDTPNTESALDRIGNLFSTHPGTEERIKQIEPLPAGQTPKQVMTAQQWEALKNACN
jgi:beta-barrel assembly-enhancing protease